MMRMYEDVYVLRTKGKEARYCTADLARGPPRREGDRPHEEAARNMEYASAYWL